MNRYKFSTAALIFAASALSASAADGTWTGTATSGNWTDSTNWASGIIADDTGSAANFTSDITATTTVSLNGVNRTLGNLVFSDNGAAGSAWVITGNTLTLAGAAPTLTTTTNATIASVIAGGSGLTKTGDGTLSLSAANTYTGNTTISRGTVNISNAAAFGSSGTVFLGDANSGASAITLNLASTVTLARNIVVSAGGSGTVTLTSTSGTATPTFSGVLTLNRATSFTYAAADRLHFGGQITGNVGTLTIDGGKRTTFGSTANNFVGDIVLNGSGTILQVGVGTAGEVIPNASNLTINTGAAIWLAASGTTTETINGLNGAGTVTMNGAVNGTNTLLVGALNASGAFSGLIANGDADSLVAVTKLGSGTQTLSGQNTYTGRTTVNGGVLDLASTTATAAISASSALTLGGGTLRLNSGTAATQTFAGLTTTANTGSAVVAGIGKTITLGALTSAGANSSVNFNTSGGGAIVLTGQTAGNAINTGFTVTDATGFGLATVDGANNVVRLAPGAALPASGATSPTDYSTSGNLTTTANQSAGSITVDTTSGAGVLTNTGFTLSNSVWNIGGVGANTYAITGGTLTAASAGGVTNFNNYNAGDVTIGAVIANNTSASAVNFAGTGKTILTGANTYTGNTVISGGTVQIGAGALNGAAGSGSINTTGTITVNTGAKLIYNRSGQTNALAGGGTVEFYGGNTGAATGGGRETTPNSGSAGFTGTVVADGIRLNVSTNANALGTGSTVIVRNFGQMFGGAATLSSNFIISGLGWGEAAGNFGTLRLDGTTLNGSVTLADDSRISTAGVSGIINGVIGESGGSRKLTLGSNYGSGSSILTLNAANGYTGGTDLIAGTGQTSTVNLGNSLALGTGAVNVLNNSTLASSGASQTIANNLAISSGVTATLSGAGGLFTLNGNISGAGNLAVSTGNVTLAGTNTYAGTTTVNGGVLTFANKAAFYNNTPASWTATNLVVNSGGTAAFNVGGAGEFSLADIDTLKALGTATGGFKNGSIIGINTSNTPGGALTYASVIANTNGGANALGFNKSGAGTLTLSGNNTYTGTTSVSGGTLILTGSNAYAGATTIAGGAGLTVAATGSVTNTASVTLGAGGGGSSLTVQGSLATAGQLTLGNGSTGNILTVANGATLSAGNISNPWGTNYVVDGTLTSAGAWVISTNNTNSISGAGTISAASLTTGNAATVLNYTATGTTTLTGLITLASTGTGSFNQSAGTVNAGGIAWGGGTNTYALTGGRLNLGASGIASTGGTTRNVNLGNATVGANADWSSAQAMTLTGAGAGTTFNTLDATNGTTARTVTLSGGLSGAGNLVKAGAGTLNLGGANSYAGTTTVSGGTLLLNAANTGTGAITVAAGATLGGTGGFTAAVNVSGILQGGAGAATGTLTTSAGAVTLASGSIIQLALGASGASSQIAFGAGGVSFQTNQAFNFLDLGVTAGSVYTLVTGAGSADTSGWTVTNAGWTGAFQNNAGTVTYALTAVPEPSTYGLLGAGALAAVAFVRRRRRMA